MKSIHSKIITLKASNNDLFQLYSRQVETPDSDALNGTFEKNSKQSLNAEGPSQPPRELVSPWETGNLTPLSLFELSQIATQSQTRHLALSFFLETILVKKNLNLTRHRGTQRLLPQVFC